MKLYTLSDDPSKPCFILSLKELNIMLDCGLVTNTVLNFLPLPLVNSLKISLMSNSGTRKHEMNLEDASILSNKIIIFTYILCVLGV